MTADEIRAAITADPALQSIAQASPPDTFALAAALSTGREKFVPTEVGNGTILEVLGLTTGNILLDLITTEPTFRHVKPLVEQGRLRLDSQLVLATLQSLVGTVLTQEQADALVARAKVPDPVDEFDVRVAIFNDDGTLRV